MLPAHGIWRETVSLLDELANKWACCSGKNASYITTKFCCHSLCDRIVLRVFSCADIVQNIDESNISQLECVWVQLGQNIKSRLEIVGVSMEVVRD